MGLIAALQGILGDVRYPRGTPYQGPYTNYDRLTSSPEANLHRIVYGLPRPLLRHRQHRDTAFYGRLFDELANSHAVLVKICRTKGSAECFAVRLRPELSRQIYSVGVKQDEDNPQPDQWLVIVYNRITRSLREPSWMRDEGVIATPEWVGVKEAARVLGVSRSHASRLVQTVPHQVLNGRSEMRIHRRELLVLANRPRRWRKRTRKAS